MWKSGFIYDRVKIMQEKERKREYGKAKRGNRAAKKTEIWLSG